MDEAFTSLLSDKKCLCCIVVCKMLHVQAGWFYFVKNYFIENLSYTLIRKLKINEWPLYYLNRSIILTFMEGIIAMWSGGQKLASRNERYQMQGDELSCRCNSIVTLHQM